MSKYKPGKTRNGRYIVTVLEHEHSRSEFHEIDNLDTKSLNDAENTYEKAFVLVRQTLEQNDSLCCDDETDRLNICQIIVDKLKESSLIRRDGW